MTARRLTQNQLESYLWGAATLLRGTIDAGEYKSFIFPLLFLKRLSDVYDEELAEALEPERPAPAAKAAAPKAPAAKAPAKKAPAKKAPAKKAPAKKTPRPSATA